MLLLEDGSGFLALEFDDAIACGLLFEDGSGTLILDDNSGYIELEICETPIIGGVGVPHTFTRKRWRELQMLIAAEEAARAKAARLTRPAKQQALIEAADAAVDAIEAARLEGENARLDRLLERNAAMLRAATRAATQVKLMKEAAAAITLSQTIARRAQDEEDEMITLLVMS